MPERIHTVSKGDTLWGISRHYRVEMAQLIALNNLRAGNQHSLQIGQSIKLPGVGETPDTELILRVLDLSFLPISRAKLRLEYDGEAHELIGNAQGEIGPIQIQDHALGIRVYFRGLDGQYALIAEHRTLPLGRKRLTLTSRSMLVRGSYLSQQGKQRKTAEAIRREVRGRNQDPHIETAEASRQSATTGVRAAAAPSGQRSQPSTSEPGLLEQAQETASELLFDVGKAASATWDWITSDKETARAPARRAASPRSDTKASSARGMPNRVVMQTRVEGGQPTQVVGALFAEANLKLLPANEKYRKIIIDVAKRHQMTPQALAAVINAEAAKARKTGEWLADSQASTSSAAGLTQFLDASWLELATEPRSLLNQKLNATTASSKSILSMPKPRREPATSTTSTERLGRDGIALAKRRCCSFASTLNIRLMLERFTRSRIWRA